LAYIGNKPANKAVVASDLDPAVITGQTALAVAPADTDEFLISDAGTLKRIDASLVGGGGKILQVVTATDGTERTTSSASFVTASNTCTLNITPSATSSKILLMFQSIGRINTHTGNMAFYTIFKGGSNLVGNEGMSGFGVNNGGNTSGYLFSGIDIKFIDSPSSTSQLTYDIRFRIESASYEARLGSGGTGSSDSTLIAMEIGA